LASISSPKQNIHKKIFFVSGWGDTIANDQQSGSQYLRAAFVYGKANQDCKKAYAVSHSVFSFSFLRKRMRIFSFHTQNFKITSQFVVLRNENEKYEI
jgi:hypothetical protein